MNDIFIKEITIFKFLECDETLVMDILKLWQLDLIYFIFRSDVMNVTVWQGKNSANLIVVLYCFLYQCNAFLYVKITFKCVWRKHFLSFSITKGHENGRKCWFLVNFFTQKHAVSTYSFHKKIGKVLNFKSWLIFFSKTLCLTHFQLFHQKYENLHIFGDAFIYIASSAFPTSLTGNSQS